MRLPALLLALAAVAPGALASGEWQVFYAERESTFHASGRVVPGEPQGYRFVLAQPNVTTVSFALRWIETDDPAGLSGPDTLALSAADPSGRPVGAPARSSEGEADVVAVVRAPPASGPVDDAALAGTLAASASRAGQGEWRASVRLEDAGNPAGAPVDAGNAFDLVVTVRWYEAVPMRVVALGRPVAGGGDVDPWLVAAGALALAAAGLGAALAWQSRRRRVPPDGDNTASPGR
ncbi:MAG TPA: hypothetical protein VHH36_09865 [Candidatus Thermoplasmatota archaeon]|nr:hypothetical protein [Candidatus Thermoplasmatota archaeon]